MNYDGWSRYEGLIKKAAKRYKFHAHTKQKNGYLAIDLPFDAPLALQKLAERIEEVTYNVCQHCGSTSATELLNPKGWVLKLCLHCASANESQV